MQTHDPHCITFRAAVSAGTHRVDRARGRINRVSLLTAGREAQGHGLWIDAQTLQSFRALLDGRKIKAYATHAPFSNDGTLEEIGLWSGVGIVGDQLVADFEALDAWRKHSAKEFETLFELADKAPAEFGVSLNFRFGLAWPMPGRPELATKREMGATGWSFTPPRPAAALRQLPSVRATSVFSADFVDRPAANDGLFRAGVASASTNSPLAEIARLRAKLAAMKGTDEKSAVLRGQIVAQINSLAKPDAS